MTKSRLDVKLVEKGLVETREKAKALIMAGEVYVDGVKSDKAGTQVSDDCIIEVKGESCPFVSRGGFKLKKALECFDIDVSGFTAMDIGASTGGFTDCLLQNGAKKVYSIDVGYGQLAYSLRCDERVTVFEKTNFRYFDKSNIDDFIDIVVMDVSFISITKLCENIKNFITNSTDMVFLIKPQFESDKNTVGKNGVITDVKQHFYIVCNVVSKLREYGFFLKNIDFSPIKGPKGNIEFISRFTLDEKEELADGNASIKAAVRNAHEQL